MEKRKGTLLIIDAVIEPILKTKLNISNLQRILINL